jgi:hypothetical protein
MDTYRYDVHRQPPFRVPRGNPPPHQSRPHPDNTSISMDITSVLACNIPPYPALASQHHHRPPQHRPHNSRHQARAPGPAANAGAQLCTCIAHRICFVVFQSQRRWPILYFASVALTFLRCLARCEAGGGRSYAAISRQVVDSDGDDVRGYWYEG